jgi:hypothetical protein
MTWEYINPLYITYATTGLFIIYSFLFHFLIRRSRRIFLIPSILLYLIGSYFVIDKLNRLIREYFSERGWLIIYTDEGTITSLILTGLCGIASIVITVVAVSKRKN